MIKRYGIAVLMLLLTNGLVWRANDAWSSEGNAPSHYYKVVQYSASADNFRKFLDAFRVNALASRQDSGVIGFNFIKNSKAPYLLTVIEEYDGRASSANHMNTEHFKIFSQKLKELKIQRSLIDGDNVDLDEATDNK